MSKSETPAREHPIAAELREYSEGNLTKDEDPLLHPIIGEIDDPDVREYVMFCAEVYEPEEPEDPNDFWETPFAKEIRRKYRTHTASHALANRHMEHLTLFSGIIGYKQDVSGMQALMELQTLIKETPVVIGYIYAAMGHGKTEFATLLLEVFESVYGREGVYIASNYDIDEQDEKVIRYSRVIELLEEGKENKDTDLSKKEIVVVIDEAAQLFTGSGSDQKRSKQLAKLLKLARKSGAHFILIGQGGKDIGPSLRTLCTMFIEKESQKEAVFWTDVIDREGVGERMRLSKVPQTSWSFSTYDEGEFIFDDEDEDDLEDYWSETEVEDLMDKHEREMLAVLDATTDMTQQEIADRYDSSTRRVQRAKKEFSDKIGELVGES